MDPTYRANHVTTTFTKYNDHLILPDFSRGLDSYSVSKDIEPRSVLARIFGPLNPWCANTVGRRRSVNLRRSFNVDSVFKSCPGVALVSISYSDTVD